MSVIQQVYLAEAGYSIYIKGIKPDKDNECSGEITINGNPVTPRVSSVVEQCTVYAKVTSSSLVLSAL